MRAAILGAALVLAAANSSCTVGEGSGAVHSNELLAVNCFAGLYDLRPDFFASSPFLDTQTLRIQRGNDIEENSDGVQIVVLSTSAMLAALNTPIRVGLPPGVTPPGIPIQPDPDPPQIELTLYLHDTCHSENAALYAVGGTIKFQHLFDGNPDEQDADNKLTQASFDVDVGDPRDEPPAGGPIPAEKLSRVVGEFQFFFQRGQPAQPFP